MNMKTVKLILFGILIAGFTVVIFRNLEQTSVELVFTTLQLPLAALLSIVFCLGFGMGFFARTLWKVRHWRNKKHQDAANGNEK